MVGQVLDVLKQHVLAEQIRDHQHVERVRRDNLRQAGGPQAPLEHALEGVRQQGPIVEGGLDQGKLGRVPKELLGRLGRIEG